MDHLHNLANSYKSIIVVVIVSLCSAACFIWTHLTCIFGFIYHIRNSHVSVFALQHLTQNNFAHVRLE